MCPMCDPTLRQLYLTASRQVRAWNRWKHIMVGSPMYPIVDSDMADLQRATEGVQPLLDAHYEHQRNPK